MSHSGSQPGSGSSSPARGGRGSLHFLRTDTPEETCAECGVGFAMRYAYQRIAIRKETAHVCSQACRSAFKERGKAPAKREPYKLAVLNQKGGTGKTTTSVNLAAGLASAGKRVLLIDVDAQGHSGISLGVRGERGLYHVIVEGADPRDCVASVNANLDVITSNETLAVAEIFLARMNEGRHRILRERFASVTDYDYVILDCAPSLSSLNMNALTYADELLVPVQCDWLSLIGVRQLMRTVRQVNELLLHPVQIAGVLPTFYDQRNRISEESVKKLRSQFGDRVLPPIRVNTRLKEAPSFHQTIFEYAPKSRGALDYQRLVKWLRNHVDQRELDKQEGVSGV